MARMRVLFASSEVYPLVKTGGLADVSAALPAALAALGVDVRLIMPGYTQAMDTAVRTGAAISLGDLLGVGEAYIVPARTPDSGLPLWLVDCPAIYCRAGGLYADADGRDWPDNALRFALLSHAVVRLATGVAGTGWQPELLHVNDWHLGLVPALLAARPKPKPPCLLTIHNLAFQGVFSAEVFPRLELPAAWFTPSGIEFYGLVSFLKAGIAFADHLTTVSPRYAREILTPEFGCGLDGLLRQRADHLVGILNGIDYNGWTPEDPAQIPFPFTARDLSGKNRCKAAIQEELGLLVNPDAPLIAFVNRLTEQKMADALPEIAPAIAARTAQLLICGEGDRSIEQTLRDLQDRFPGHIAVRTGYEESLTRRALAGADIMLAPSRFEPCGLTQMYAMRYGTIPIACRVGGLADTVVDQEEDQTAPPRRATGFLFDGPTVDQLNNAIERAWHVYREPIAWRAMQLRAMRQDFRWRRSAERYRNLYRALIGKEHGKRQAQRPEPMILRPTGS